MGPRPIWGPGACVSVGTNEMLPESTASGRTVFRGEHCRSGSELRAERAPEAGPRDRVAGWVMHTVVSRKALCKGTLNPET